MKPSSGTKTSGAETVQWDLSDLYESPSDPNLQNDKEHVLQQAGVFNQTYRGKVNDLEPEKFGAALKEYEQIIQTLRKIGSYAHLIWSTNTEDPELGKLLQESSELSSEISQKLVFFDVEWLKLSDEKAKRITEAEELKEWRHYLNVSRLYKSHTLSEDAEQVMSAKSVTGRAAWNRYFDETLGAARFDFEGEPLTEQEVLSKLHNPDRVLRKKAHQSLTKTFEAHSRTLTFIFNTILADTYTNDKLRKYKSWISSRNLSNQTDDETVDALVHAVTGNYALVQRYYRLKKKAAWPG